MSEIHVAKLALRQRIVALRDAMPTEQRAAESALLTERLLANIRIQRATSVMAYCSFGSEVSTRAFLNAVLSAGKLLILPRIDRAAHSLALYRVTDTVKDLVPGEWGILEPRADPARSCTVGEAAVVLTPGLAFDAQCNRMGYGKAYYDRLFASSQGVLPYRLAVAFDCQLVEQVPVTSNDIPLHCILTPTHEYSR